MNRLTDAKLRGAKPKKKPYKLSDGGGLYVLINSTGTKLWRYKYRIASKENCFAIGRYPDITLSTARDLHTEARKLVQQGTHPTQERKLQRLRQRHEHASTFEAVAWEWYTKQKPHWGTPWTNKVKLLLDRDLLPKLGPMPIRDVTAQHVLEVLLTVEGRGHAYLATLVRQVASKIFRYAAVTLRADNDPAAALNGAIRAPKVRHHHTFEDREIPVFIRKLDDHGGEPTTVLALRLLLLTFTRKMELLDANWSEIEWDNALWRIPGERMKMEATHLVPLSIQTLELLHKLHEHTGSTDKLFPNRRDPARCIAPSTINVALTALGVSVPPHGFRGTASTILNEMGFPPDVVERQLAHSPKDKVRASYNHAQYLKERKVMMQKWANHLDNLKESADIVPIKRSA